MDYQLLLNPPNQVLIACEESGKVRDALQKYNIDAISCDLIESRIPGKHIVSDVLPLLKLPWRGIIAFPPCTDICVSGARHFVIKQKDGRQKAAINFFMACINANSNYICVENPVGIMSTHYQKPTQYIQPHEYGHGETKKTCLWLKNLPALIPTNKVPERESKIHKMPPSKDRAKLRSETYQGIADAMAAQWHAFFL